MLVATIVLMMFMLVCLIMFATLRKGVNDSVDYDDEEVVTTTTTVHHDEGCCLPRVAGVLNVESHSNGDRFVVDPADGVKFPVTRGDDMYEDADGRVWRLVGNNR